MRPPLDGVRVFPPVEHPPLTTWVGVGGSPQSVVRAARYGFPLTLAIIGGDPRRFKPYVELYHRALTQLGHARCRLASTRPATSRRPMPQAREELWPALSGHAEPDRGRAGLGADQPGRVRSGDRRRVAVRRLARDRRPEDRGHRRALGASRFDLKYSAGTLGHEIMLRSIELYGREVIPRVRQELGAGSLELEASRLERSEGIPTHRPG